MITINEIELATKLAHAKTISKCIRIDIINIIDEMYKDNNVDMLEYKDDIQDIFNNFYDYYLSEIEDCKI